MSSEKTLDKKHLIVEALDDLKAKDITCVDVTEFSDVMDTLVIATGTSNRHVKSLANNVIDELKKHQVRKQGIEGLDVGEWVLVDYGDVVVHTMLQATRDLYDLEKLWSLAPSSRQQDDA